MLNIKESVKILFIVTVSVLTVGCKKHNAEYTLSENTGDVSSVVSETAAKAKRFLRRIMYPRNPVQMLHKVHQPKALIS